MQNNNQISTEIITHYAVVEKEDKKFPMTMAQADTLRDILKWESTMKYITIPNPKDPFWEPLWEWRAWWVRVEFIDRKDYAWLWFYCDFWHFHSVNDNCMHHIKYEISPLVFWEKLLKKFPNVKYNNDITHSMRIVVLGK